MTLIGQTICILGAGIGGLATALALALRGADVTILEQADAISEVGAGLQISPNGFAVLRALGLGDAIDAAGLRGSRVMLRDYRQGTPVFQLDLMREAGLPYYFMHRADLVALLADAARAAGVKIRLLHHITGVDIEPDVAYLTTAQGAVHEAAVLIGADGLHSKVRPAMNPAVSPFFTQQVAWRAVVPAADPSTAVSVHMGPGRHIVSYPLRGGTLRNIVAVQERRTWADEGWNHRDDPANLRNAFADFAPEVRAMLDDVQETHLWGLFRHPVAQRWHQGCAAILGDAAHPTLPFLAQGANMALEDAWVLADSLALTNRPADGFALYQSRRHARVTKVIDAASRNARNYHLAFPPLRFAAHSALRIASTLAPQLAARKFDWLYQFDATAA